jgi:hypothetical protein
MITRSTVSPLVPIADENAFCTFRRHFPLPIIWRSIRTPPSSSTSPAACLAWRSATPSASASVRLISQLMSFGRLKTLCSALPAMLRPCFAMCLDTCLNVRFDIHVMANLSTFPAGCRASTRPTAALPADCWSRRIEAGSRLASCAPAGARSAGTVTAGVVAGASCSAMCSTARS